MLLRIEDLDTDRCRPEYSELLLRDLEWLGLDWDEGPYAERGNGPYYQSLRGEIYQAAVNRLSEQKRLYPCFCTRADLHTADAPHRADGTFLYDGRCARLTSEEARQMSRIRRPAYRIAVEEADICFCDLRYGYQRSCLSEDCGDFVVMRSDGTASYQLAVSVDDAMMGVTEVVRGADLLSSTARQIFLYLCLGFRPPDYCHMPLLLAQDGRRLSKRDADLDLGRIMTRMTAPQLLGKLAYRLGLIEREESVSARELIPYYDLHKIQAGDLMIDPDDFR